MAKATSMKMKASLIQKEYAKIGCSRKCMPRRWYSAVMKIAEMMYPMLLGVNCAHSIDRSTHMNTASIDTCTRG